MVRGIWVGVGVGGEGAEAVKVGGVPQVVDWMARMVMFCGMGIVLCRLFYGNLGECVVMAWKSRGSVIDVSSGHK